MSYSSSIDSNLQLMGTQTCTNFQYLFIIVLPIIIKFHLFVVRVNDPATKKDLKYTNPIKNLILLNPILLLSKYKYIL